MPKIKIMSFKNEYSFLSNFYISPFKYEDRIWSTVEHAFQACKTTSLEEQEMIRMSSSPSKAKRLGRFYTLRKDWEDVKFPLMFQLVFAKFKQNPVIKSKLLETGIISLVEGNYWHDNVWGNCFCNTCKDFEGKNHLGHILQQIRHEMRLPSN